MPNKIKLCIFLTLSSKSSFLAVLLVSSFNQMIFAGIFMGVAKGVRTVYMSLVIPEYVPIERLASASGLQMTINSLFLIGFGPVVGM